MKAEGDNKPEFIEHFTGRMIDLCGTDFGPSIHEEARAGTDLSGVYSGSSAKIKRMITLAYMRGMRRGVSLVWDGRQRVSMRSVSVPDSPPRNVQD